MEAARKITVEVPLDLLERRNERAVPASPRPPVPGCC
jgi:hypothetical protein